MWRFCSLFSSIAMLWCIMNYFQKVVRSTLKLCSDYLKQYASNAQNCGKTNHAAILQHYNAPAHTSMFWQKQNSNHASTTVFTGHGTRWLFPLTETEDINEKIAFCYDWGDKRKLVTEAIGDTEKRVSEYYERNTSTVV